MATGYSQQRLGRFFRIKHGYAFKGEHFVGAGTHVVLTPGNFERTGGLKLKGDKEKYYDGEIPAEYILRRGDLVVAMTDLTQNAPILGAPALIPDDDRYLHNQRLGKVVDLDETQLDKRYLYYVFNLPATREQLKATATGATVKHTAPDRIHQVEAPIPPLPIQRRVANVLSAYDALVENNVKRIKVLEEMARSLYREWFESSERKRRGSVSTVQDLVDRDILEINDGYRAKNSELGQPGLPFARAGNVNDGFHFEDADLLHKSNVPKAGTKVSRAGDVVFTSKGTVGRFAWVRPETPAFVYSPQLCFWRVLRAEVVEPSYLFRWMQSRAFIEQVNRVKGSTAMADYVSLTDQRRMHVDVPAPERQRAFASAVAPMDALAANLQASNHILRTTRDLLLPKLVSGEVLIEVDGDHPAPPVSSPRFRSADTTPPAKSART